MENEADEVLATMAQAGSNPAFAELMQRHQPNCLKIALSVLRDATAAEDEVQNAFWKAFQHLNQFQHDAKFSTWLTRIVLNQCLMRLRRERKLKLISVDAAAATNTVYLRDPAVGPEARLGSREVATVLQSEIARIPPLLRNVFVLRDVEEKPMTDVAAELGISVAAAKSRLLRARIELRHRLEKHCGRVGPATLMA